MSTAELRLPKRPVPLDVALADGTVRHVCVFLSPWVSTHSGGERLADLLNRPEPFFPAEERGDGAVVQIARAAILYVKAAVDDADADAFEDHAVDVTVTLDGGQRLRGLVRYAAAPDRARLTDHLNGPEAFFVLHDDPQLVFVRKARVSTVLEAAPAA